jgi:fructan beta-fructosidase
MKRTLLTLSCLVASLPARAAHRPDLLLADFEGSDYGAWKTTGTAFGTAPARGTLPGQMPVTGYLGKGLVNSFHGGDGSTGTLTSRPFTVARRHLNFLIGGGKYPGKTCINLLVGGKVVRTATGPNDRPGGSEHLDWHTWDVADLAGKQAIIQIVDDHTGGWGHITVDHIVQSDRPRGLQPARRDFTVTARYLNLPVRTGAPRRRLKFVIDGKAVREFEIELDAERPGFWVFCDLGAFKGKRLRVEGLLPAGAADLAALAQADAIKGAGTLYKEKARPQFHFTSRRGWLNDPNGLVFHAGTYHLFYQHNPYGWDWGNMHWGHAVSSDLVRWRELPLALYPRRFGDWCFSGSAVVDEANTSGFGAPGRPALVAAYTSTGRGECIVSSTDGGRTWSEYAGNPVVRHRGRDPRLLWHAPTKRWVMAVYDEEKGRAIAFYTSPDLKKWTYRSRIDDFYECPDLFALPVDGDAKKSKWVLYGADCRYLLGDFDGTTFRKESGKHQLWYGNFYAAQTFSNAPGGRRIQIGWGQGIAFPGSPFNQQMTFPCELTLRTTEEGVRLFARPVTEVARLHTKKHAQKDRPLRPGADLAAGASELLDVRAELEVGKAAAVGCRVRGVEVVYDPKKKQLECRGRTAPLPAKAGKVRLQVLVDRGSVEVFGNDGRVALSVGVLVPEKERQVALFARGGEAKVVSLEVHELRSAWR